MFTNERDADLLTLSVRSQNSSEHSYEMVALIHSRPTIAVLTDVHVLKQIDFRETMPGLGNETMYVDSNDTTASTVGGLAVGTPGEMRGWEMLHKRHGKLPWATLFQPAIKLAGEGFKVTVDLAAALSNSECIMSV